MDKRQQLNKDVFGLFVSLVSPIPSWIIRMAEPNQPHNPRRHFYSIGIKHYVQYNLDIEFINFMVAFKSIIEGRYIGRTDPFCELQRDQPITNHDSLRHMMIF